MMTRIKFNTDQISVPEIAEFFAKFMFASKPMPVKHGIIILGALTFLPDGILRTTVPEDNIALRMILEEYRKAGYDYKIL